MEDAHRGEATQVGRVLADAEVSGRGGPPPANTKAGRQFEFTKLRTVNIGDGYRAGGHQDDKQ